VKCGAYRAYISGLFHYNSTMAEETQNSTDTLLEFWDSESPNDTSSDRMVTPHSTGVIDTPEEANIAAGRHADLCRQIMALYRDLRALG
jgi:hypothetical protein